MKLVKLLITRPVSAGLLFSFWMHTQGQDFKEAVSPLIEASCISCHDAETDTQLNFEKLSYNLSDVRTFRRWVNVFDRLERGEMPPKSKPRPSTALSDKALVALSKNLHSENLKKQKTNGRVPARRLTRLEYEFTLHDLLNIHGELAKHLPPDISSASFDTIAIKQGISPVHISNYLDTADMALSEAIQLGRQPLGRSGQIRKIDDDAVVILSKQNFISRSDALGFRPRIPGIYRISAQIYSSQANATTTLLVNRGSDREKRTEIIRAFDLPSKRARQLELITHLRPDNFFYLSVAPLNWQADGIKIFAKRGRKHIPNNGIAIKWIKIIGPLEKKWPPTSTRNLLPGVQFKHNDYGDYTIELTQAPIKHVTTIVERFAPLAFRQPVSNNITEPFIRLAESGLQGGLTFEQAVRISLRGILNSPHFLFHDTKPGALDDFALATRLSYFLWKSLPDAKLFRLALEKKLSEPDVLAAQVDRLLNDSKSSRFFNDYLDSWLGLRDIEATTPDRKLYPEYDELMLESMLAETRLFFRELINRDLSVRNFIDSDFIHINHALAAHYGIPGITGEQMRKISLPEGSVRGGLMTQASILKVTANGTFTSPVKRGNFVLTSLLGTPPSPPPADIGSIEPDTRGTSTIREALAKHRNVAICADCHRHIDPPGFALESFDPIGGFRTRYRTTEQGTSRKRSLLDGRVFQIREGPRVNSSGITSDGKSFGDIREFKKHLLSRQEQVARHFIAQLTVYATGGTIQFSDRKEIERIVRETRPSGFPARSIIHQIVQSKLFRNK